MPIRRLDPGDDAGRRRVDVKLKQLEREISRSYRRAAQEMKYDLDEFLSKYEAKDLIKREQLQKGIISEEDYISWRKGQIFQSEHMQAKIADLTTTALNADKKAMQLVNNELPAVYATAFNYGGFRGEKYAQAAGFDYTQFTIINEDAVRILATEDPDLIPWKPVVDVPKDKQWNRQHIQNAIQQGIIKGDSMDKIADRLLPVVNMDEHAAIRTARTAVNGVENRGRKEATERVREAGIPMVEQWGCVHDSRTRDTHILLDGTLPNEDGLFGEGILNKLMAYPGDPSGDPADVYNCRCRLNSYIDGIDHSKDMELYEQFLQDNYYDDWLDYKEKQTPKEAAFQEHKQRAEARRTAKVQQYVKQEGDGTYGKDENGHKYTKEEYDNRLKELDEFSKYHYHATTVGAVKGIKEEGLLPSEGHFGQGVYMARTEDSAKQWTEGTSTGGNVVIRVKNTYLAKTDYMDIEPGKGGEGLSAATIPVKELEVKTAEGKWIPLKDCVVSYRRGKPYIIRRPK